MHQLQNYLEAAQSINQIKDSFNALQESEFQLNSTLKATIKKELNTLDKDNINKRDNLINIFKKFLNNQEILDVYIRLRDK